MIGTTTICHLVLTRINVLDGILMVLVFWLLKEMKEIISKNGIGKKEVCSNIVIIHSGIGISIA